MPRPRIFVLTLLAMLAFAGNSLLCRAALQAGRIDAASFTAIRVVAGALALWLIVRLQRGRAGQAGSWLSALALFAYAAGFSFAYIQTLIGSTVKRDMPQLTGPEVERLYARGKTWLAGGALER